MKQKFEWTSVGVPTNERKTKSKGQHDRSLEWILQCIEVATWESDYKSNKGSKKVRKPRTKRKCNTCGKY